MNTSLVAAALRALADAIETPAAVAQTAPAALAPPIAAKRGPGRPAKGETPAAPAVATPAAVAAPTAAAAVPATAPTAAKLTHKDLAPTFLAAAKAHGRGFVVQVMKQVGATGDPEPTFDKVPVDRLPDAKALLLAGPQKAPVVDDGSDLLG